MVSTFTPQRGYEQPGTGDYVDTWGPVINNNFSIIDRNISSTLTVSLNSSNVTLTASQAQNMAFLLTGTLTADVSLIYPQTGAFFIVRNATSGAFRVTVITSAGGSVGVFVNQGQIATLYSNGTDVFYADDTARVPVGSIVDFAGATAPFGWLLCDGSAISRTTYSGLFAVINTIYGAGNGSTTFNLPDCRGRLRAGLDNMGGTAALRITSAGSGINALVSGASGGAQNVTLTVGTMPSHAHGASSIPIDPGHAHSGPSGSPFVIPRNPGNFATAVPGSPNTTSAESTTAVSGTNISISTAVHNTGNNEAHQNMPPTIVFNTIIRAL
jgi:microcystin-dependent protein